MKLNPLVLLFLAPFYLIAQPDDYCPCMEESRQYEDLMQYFSSTADVSVNVQPQSYTTNHYVQRESPEPAFVPIYMDVSNFPTAVAKKEKVEEEKKMEEEKPEKVERVTADRSGSKARSKAKIKRKRKRLKGKVKRKKRLKKYKGGCPFF